MFHTTVTKMNIPWFKLLVVGWIYIRGIIRNNCTSSQSVGLAFAGEMVGCCISKFVFANKIILCMQWLETKFPACDISTIRYSVGILDLLTCISFVSNLQFILKNMFHYLICMQLDLTSWPVVCFVNLRNTMECYICEFVWSSHAIWYCWSNIAFK